jgi:hypothetical protein
MKTKTTILIIFILTFLFSYGQKVQTFSYERDVQIKKETKIVNTFDYDYIKGEELYLSKKGKVKTDTIIKEFNLDGTLKKSYRSPYVTFSKIINLDSIVQISTENNFKHQREYWSDTTLIDIFTQNFGDSIIQIKTSGSDTIQINKSYFHKGKLVKCHNRDLRYSYGKFNEVITYEKKTKNHEIAIIITTYYENGLTDTIKIDNNKKRNKTFVFNSDKNEWFVKEKVKSKKRKIIIKETFYHDYHKMYFTTKITTIYNKYGLPISEIKYDTYLKHIESETTYKYDYY